MGVSSGSGGHSERQALCKGLPRPEHPESPQLCGTMGLARRTGNVVKNGQASFIRPPSLHGSNLTHLSGLVGGSKMGLGTHQLPSNAVQTPRPSFSEKPSHFQLPSYLPLPRLVFWALLVTTSWDVGVDRARSGDKLSWGPQCTWLPLCVYGDRGVGQSDWEVPRQCPQKEGILHMLHNSEQLGNGGHLEKKAGDTAGDLSLYATFVYCHHVSVGPSAETGTGQRREEGTARLFTECQTQWGVKNKHL